MRIAIGSLQMSDHSQPILTGEAGVRRLQLFRGLSLFVSMAQSAPTIRTTEPVQRFKASTVHLRPIASVLISIMNVRITEVPIQRLNGSLQTDESDYLAAEEPLEIRVEGRNVAVVMRTPGEDEELAAGFLVTEGLIRDTADIVNISHVPHCPEASSGSRLMDGNAVNVRLKNPAVLDFGKLTRHVFTSSSCGICSKATIEAVRRQFPPIDDACAVDSEVLSRLPQALSVSQHAFNRTGGLHACALFDLRGNLLMLREDVGRHNALDKVIGRSLLNNCMPLKERVLLLSGRASFEMMQKALAGGVAIVAAISAPSSLAVMFARDSGQTLVGFLRNTRMNIYAGTERVVNAVSLANGPSISKREMPAK